jgi:hypothetical protein
VGDARNPKLSAVRKTDIDLSDGHGPHQSFDQRVAAAPEQQKFDYASTIWFHICDSG